MKLAVVIPSRTCPRQAEFLTRSTASVKAQKTDSEIEMVLAVDSKLLPLLPFMSDEVKNIHFAISRKTTQSAAMNAGVRKAQELGANFLAFLEDDDWWHPERVKYALEILKHCDFTSSTQLEVDGFGDILRINDFPTPSGWLMSMACWERVGEFDESYRWHLDNEWLGRLGDNASITRSHLVECTAPIERGYISQVRPWLAGCLGNGGARNNLQRHPLPFPLVKRLVHGGSGMLNLDVEESLAEYARLLKEYGRIPW